MGFQAAQVIDAERPARLAGRPDETGTRAMARVLPVVASKRPGSLPTLARRGEVVDGGQLIAWAPPVFAPERVMEGADAVSFGPGPCEVCSPMAVRFTGGLLGWPATVSKNSGRF